MSGGMGSRVVQMGDPTRDEMVAELKREFLESDDDGGHLFNREQAIYWFASDWHHGEASNLYSALSASDYRPGPSENGCEGYEEAAVMYAHLETAFATGGAS